MKFYLDGTVSFRVALIFLQELMKRNLCPSEYPNKRYITTRTSNAESGKKERNYNMVYRNTRLSQSL